MRRLLPLIAVLSLPAAPAQAVTVPAPVAQRCSHVPGARPGAAVERHTVAADGLLTVTLRARGGDWDLSLWDAGGARLAAASTGAAGEIAFAPVRAGRRVTAVACRVAGPSRSAQLSFDLYPLTPRPRVPIRLVRVAGDPARAEAAGLDVTHAGDVVLYDPADERALRAAGLRITETLAADLRAVDAANAALDRRRARSGRSALPSGQASYRTAADYGEQLKALVAAHPAIARRVEIGRSLEDRPLEGIELAEGVTRTDDGRPTFLVLGLHHAREWPSGEMPMEFAYTLAEGYGSDARITALLQRVRVLILPVMNPDGFAVSRAAGYTDADNTAGGGATDAQLDRGAYKRKNCRPQPGSEAVPCALRWPQGVDLNRNYGAYWGGDGSSDSYSAQNYRGTGPYSEPESEAVHRLSATRMITTVVTHHTYTDDGVWLREPGFCQDPCDGADVTPDEAGMKALGDAMAQATGWRSAPGWDIGEITGATEDWNYFTQGAYGFTPEQRGVNFHPAYETAVVAEYDGTAPGAQGGVREALLRAAEQAGDRAAHGVLAGTAPAGRTLRLLKAFDTPTSQPGVVVHDRLDFTLTVPAGGAFEWDVNPSTRPLAGAPEAYTLRCEAPDGAVLAERPVSVARGQRVVVDDACATPAAAGVPAPIATAPTLRLRLSARTRVRLGARLRVAVTATGTAATAVVVVLVDRRGRTAARGRLARIAAGGTRVVTLKRTRVRMAPGRYRLTARAAEGATARRAIRLRR